MKCHGSVLRGQFSTLLQPCGEVPLLGRWDFLKSEFGSSAVVFMVERSRGVVKCPKERWESNFKVCFFMFIFLGSILGSSYFWTGWNKNHQGPTKMMDVKEPSCVKVKTIKGEQWIVPLKWLIQHILFISHVLHVIYCIVLHVTFHTFYIYILYLNIMYKLHYVLCIMYIKHIIYIKYIVYIKYTVYGKYIVYIIYVVCNVNKYTYV